MGILKVEAGGFATPYIYTAYRDGVAVLTWDDSTASAGEVSEWAMLHIESDRGYAMTGYIDNVDIGSFSDLFTRADGTVGNGWTDGSKPLSISSNTLTSLANPTHTGDLADRIDRSITRPLDGADSIALDLVPTGSTFGLNHALWMHFGGSLALPSIVLSVDSGGGWKIWRITATTATVEASTSQPNNAARITFERVAQPVIATPVEWRSIGCDRPGGLYDNFNRTTATILDRADNGKWSCADLTLWAIQDNRLTFGWNGMPSPISTHWFYADYQYDKTVTVRCRFAHKYEAGIVWWIATDKNESTGYEVAYNADFPRLSIQPISGDGAYFATAATPFGGDGVEREIEIRYNYETGLIEVDIDGVNYISTIVPGVPSNGTGLGLITTRDYSFFGSYYDDVQISGTHTPIEGRLRMQLSDGSWVRETCAESRALGGVSHPLKIEDPDNPGTWITVACMVPV